ncbi:hypothetical protein, partial [Streptomyces sp. 7N604]|uniref:hypothetical protein n=1 Tax=Streptomyces sp. 7N604 TaxID=3457415 RepID=UPI003FD5E7AF
MTTHFHRRPTVTARTDTGVPAPSPAPVPAPGPRDASIVTGPHDDARRQWAVSAATSTLVLAADREAAESFADGRPHLTVVSRLPGQDWQPVALPAPAGQGEYEVTWCIQLSASSPQDAARRALASHRDPGSIACVYEVTRADQLSAMVQVDLNTPEEIDGPIRGRELPIDLEQLPDDLLFQVHTQAAEILSSRVDDALPG